MQRPSHAISQAEAGRMSPQRMAAIGAVGAIHIVFIWALVTGMAQKIVKALPPELKVDIVTAPPAPPTPPSVPTPMQIAPKDIPDVPPPVIDIQQSAPTAPVQVTTSAAPPANTSLSGVINTHTIPPYPDIAKRLGEQGFVQLHLTISPAGDVTQATVTKSSGFADLDQTAVDWVVAHWKYKPAVQNGAPVASATDAIVKFDLHKVS